MSSEARNYLADHDAPISMLSLKDKFFPHLTDREQKYAHFMSKASHAGTRIVLRQVSHESEAIFDLILEIHKNLNGEYPNDTEETTAYLDYVAQFLSNLGNYKNFGNSKFTPACSKQFFFTLLELASIDLNKIPSAGPFDTLRELIEIGIYSWGEKMAFLGFPADGYVSSYYLGEKVSSKDMFMLKEKVFGKLNILPENTRINKLSDKCFEILVASKSYHNTIADVYPESQLHLANGITVQFKFGDHSREMGLIVSYLQEAKNYAANEIQSKMLDEYITYFTSGSSQAHKNSQKLWVKDLSPNIETDIGFIETYREPSGIIGEFEALVAIQNKEKTAKFTAMIQNAQEFISLLSWDPEFEKPTFIPPDFTSLEVLTLTGSAIPAGINIPNYDDVRIEIGFKNVSLGNILSAAAKSSSKHPPSFISEKDRPIYEKYQGDSLEVHVAIHEFLGHGSGKLLSELKNGFNFDKNNPPLGLDGKPITTYYKLGETWGSKFEELAGPFEECRAEVIAMYLVTNRKLLKIFGFTKTEDQENIIYAAYLQMCRAGLMALEYWDPNIGKWGQPHMQARFSIMKTFIKHSPNPDLLKIATRVDDLCIELDRSLIETAGHECMEDYLKHLHIYKCSADFERGSKYFIERSTVTPDLAKLRETVIRKRLPRNQFIQANTSITAQKVNLHEYPETPMGMLQSFLEREV